MGFFAKHDQKGVPMLGVVPVLVSLTLVAVQVEALEVAVVILGRGHQVRPLADVVELAVASIEVAWS